MNWALFTTMLRSEARSIASFGIGMILYLWLYIWIYPSFAGSQSLNHLLQKMPAGLLRVLGYTAGVNHLSTFLAGEFYSFLYLVIMSIFVLYSATKLIAHLVDNGSMAYLLATPISRTTIATTEALVLLCGVWIIAVGTTLGGLLGAHWFLLHAHLETSFFIDVNLMGALLFSVIAAYGFLFSCLLNDARSALGVSALLTILFYGAHTLGELTLRWAWMKRLSLFTAFNPQRLMQGQAHFTLEATMLAVIAAIVLVIAVLGFKRRQLFL